MGGCPSAADAQQKAMPVVGYLAATSPGPGVFVAAFRQGLRETGYVEGKNVAIEYRWAESHYDRLPALAADLVSHKVDVIAAPSSLSAGAANNATSTIPIVFVGGDPIEQDLVAALARPGGNLTGFSLQVGELMPKRLDLVSGLVSQAGIIGLLVNPNYPIPEPTLREVQDAARTKGCLLHVLKAATDTEIEPAFAELVRLHIAALIIGPDPFLGSRSGQLIALAARYAVPTIYTFREDVVAGGLISYGPSLTDTWRQLGIYAGRILKGAKPADLPVQQPTKFELVINLKTANALGLAVPQSLLARADEVIE